MNTNEWLNVATKGKSGNRVRAVMADGFSVSIQADAAKYCYPRINTGPWSEVELGYSSEPDALLDEYAEPNGDGGTTGIYGYVPVEVIDQLIAKHGGIVNGGAS